MTAFQLWWITLGAGVVVVIILGVLLMLILKTAQRIARTLGEIWTRGQSIANNTVHADLLRRSAVVSEEILASLELSLQYASPARSATGGRPT